MYFIINKASYLINVFFSELYDFDYNVQPLSIFLIIHIN